MLYRRGASSSGSSSVAAKSMYTAKTEALNRNRKWPHSRWIVVLYWRGASSSGGRSVVA